jgi:hypothetical protein
MRDFGRPSEEQPFAWTLRLLALNSLIMIGILSLFYATDHKGLAMRLMRTVNPLCSLLPRITENMRPTALTVRFYDFLVVLVMAIPGCAIGSIIDLIRWLRRRKLGKGSPGLAF